MSKSKSDILLALALAFLGGCDALRTPVPEDPPTPIRASLAGFVGKGWASRVFVSRPVDDPSETNLELPWIDESASMIVTEVDFGTGAEITSQNRFFERRGLTGSADPWVPFAATATRLRGVLVWNASTPYTVSSDAMVSDSFEIRPQPGTRVRFLRDQVRGELCLRWPKLALANEDSLYRWSWNSDSLTSFVDDWISVARGRGDFGAKLLLLDTTSRPFIYRWNDPDASVVRRVLRGETAQTIFSVGDSIWIPDGRVGYLLVNLDTTDFKPVLLDQTAWSSPTSARFLTPSISNGTMVEVGADSPMIFPLRDRSGNFYTQQPVRVLLQIAGTCPAFADWRHYGSTDRWHQPTGNVAPFDGYLCEIFPDTISFPRGDVVLMKPDTSTSKGHIVAPSINIQLQPVNP